MDESEEEQYAAQRGQQIEWLQRHLLEQVQRAHVEGVRHEFQKSPDGLINLIKKTVFGRSSQHGLPYKNC